MFLHSSTLLEGLELLDELLEELELPDPLESDAQSVPVQFPVQTEQ